MKKFLISILSLIFVISLVGCGSSTAANTQPKQDTQQKQEVKEEPLNKVNFDGVITPTIATVGDKVVISITVENLDETKPINNIRLLFDDNKFITDGLTIVNVMSGGVQDGRSFKWNGDLTKIPPKEKRTFQIVAKANKVGNYESGIQITPTDSYKNYVLPNGNEELVAKLTVTQ